MLKKISVCFFVVLLLAFMVVPAFAVSAGSDGSPIYAAFPISEVHIQDGEHKGSTFAWPANYCNDSGRFVITDFTSSASSVPFASVQTYYTNYENDKPLITSLVTIPGDCHRFSFRLDEIFNITGGSAEFILPANLCTYITEIRIQGFYYEPVVKGDSYDFQYTQFARTWNVDPSIELESFQLGSYLRSASDNPGNAGGFCYSNCFIEVTLTDVYIPSGIEFFICADVVADDHSPYAEPYFIQWFNYLSLDYQSIVSIPGGMFQWLLDSVNAFFNIQILPGFSINSIFYVVVVISVLLAVIKIMT